MTSSPLSYSQRSGLLRVFHVELENLHITSNSTIYFIHGVDCSNVNYEQVQVLSSSKSSLFLLLVVEPATWYYLPTPPLGQDMTQGQFLSGV